MRHEDGEPGDPQDPRVDTFRDLLRELTHSGPRTALFAVAVAAFVGAFGVMVGWALVVVVVAHPIPMAVAGIVAAAYGTRLLICWRRDRG